MGLLGCWGGEGQRGEKEKNGTRSSFVLGEKKPPTIIQIKSYALSLTNLAKLCLFGLYLH